MNIIRIIRGTASVCAGIIFSAFALSQPLSAAPITGFADIEYWVGTGSNQAALVIDWNDGIAPVSLAWGFRWDGIATGQDMFLAIAGTTQGDVTATGADSRLSIFITSYGFGDAIDRIVYSGPGYTHDSAGFLSGGFWEYFCMGGTFDTPPDGIPNAFAGSSSYPGTGGAPDWTSSWTGFSDRVLSDGSWDGWSFAPDFVSEAIAQPIAAVPEPGSIVLLAAGGAIFLVRRWQGRKS
ncbi:MAG TPA: PEP-CTERM sorting domain-containing protein [Terrimicrobiaceae bacterium]|nr:PEP-CTERM sorting domain-containing protein [Terrimicrobiaceae bacterium]